MSVSVPATSFGQANLPEYKRGAANPNAGAVAHRPIALVETAIIFTL